LMHTGIAMSHDGISWLRGDGFSKLEGHRGLCLAVLHSRCYCCCCCCCWCCCCCLVYALSRCCCVS
jgi:hypothetical protein